jgi:hypothetical protein
MSRRSALPTNVIVLGPNATGEMLGAAFAAFDQRQKFFGDGLDNDLVIHRAEVSGDQRRDAKYLKRMDDIMDELRKARRATSTA